MLLLQVWIYLHIMQNVYTNQHWRTQGGGARGVTAPPPPPGAPPVENVALKCPLEWRKRENVPYWLPFTKET